MKRIFTAALGVVLLLTVPGLAQDATPLLEALGPDVNDTAFEQYLDERDRLIVERIHRRPPLPLSAGASLEMEAVVAFEPARLQERMLGIRIRIIGTALTGRAALSHLDLREVEELVRAIDIMDELIAVEPGESDVEVRHVSRDGFGIVARRVGGRRLFAIRLHGAPETDPVEIEIVRSTLAAFREHLDQSRRYLFEH